MAILFCSCEKEINRPGYDKNREIYLRASVEKGIESKAPVLNNPGNGKSLDVAVWASTTDDKYLNKDLNGTTSSEVAIHTTGHFVNTTPQLLANAIYPKFNDVTSTVYFTAYHPQIGWSTNATGTNATFTFEGNEDVMFAPQVSGQYGTDINNSPTLRFKHLLTLLSVEILAETEDVSLAWGKLESISIQNKDNAGMDSRVEIDLTNIAVNTADPNASNYYDFIDRQYIKFSNSISKFNLYSYSDGSIYPPAGGIAIPDKDHTSEYEKVAYVMCPPVEALVPSADPLDNTKEYVITISTTNRSNITVPVDLVESFDANTSTTTYFSGSTMGYHFTLKLLFKMGDKISVTATVKDWKNGGMGIGDLYE